MRSWNDNSRVAHRLLGWPTSICVLGTTYHCFALRLQSKRLAIAIAFNWKSVSFNFTMMDVPIKKHFFVTP